MLCCYTITVIVCLLKEMYALALPSHIMKKVSSTEDIMITTRGENDKVVPGVEGFHSISVTGRRDVSER